MNTLFSFTFFVVSKWNFLHPVLFLSIFHRARKQIKFHVMLHRECYTELALESFGPKYFTFEIHISEDSSVIYRVQSHCIHAL